MPQTTKSSLGSFPAKEILKSIPGIFGIRLDEQPTFELLRKEGQIEIRRYEPMLLARVSVAGEHGHAVDEGFDRLAKYIFGENDSETTLSMTSPVYQEEEHANRLAPIFHEKMEEGIWTISFVMPSHVTLETAPKPRDVGIDLVEVPARTVAVLKYTGNNDDDALREAEVDLRAWLVRAGITMASPFRWAQYDAPFTIPFLKKNEAQVEIVDDASENDE